MIQHYKMYERIKKIIKQLLPDNVLFNLEPLFRSFYYPFYRGKKYQCPVCRKNLRKFIQLQHGDLLCPYCGSISRNRRLWQMLISDFLNDGAHILDFSPSRCLYRVLRKYPAINYTSSDFAGEFISDKQYDITHIDLPDDSLDIIICYHILEHIEDDQKAISELFRVLKKGGRCLIQTPFKEGEILEDAAIKSPEDRTKQFGQSDHVRVYSVNGLKERLINGGFTPNIREFNEPPDNKNGFQPNETVIIVRK